MYFAGSRLYSHTLTGSNTRNVLSPPCVRPSDQQRPSHASHTLHLQVRNVAYRIALYAIGPAPRLDAPTRSHPTLSLALGRPAS